MPSDDLREDGRARCLECEGVIADDTMVYAKMRFGRMVYQHVEHGPIALIYHGTFGHTSRCDTGGCHD